MRINKDNYFVLFLLFIISLALFQCFVIPPVLYRSAPLFRGVSIVPVVFRCSGIVPSFSGCSMFRWCSVVPALFRRSAGVPYSGAPGFIVCHD